MRYAEALWNRVLGGFQERGIAEQLMRELVAGSAICCISAGGKKQGVSEMRNSSGARAWRAQLRAAPGSARAGSRD